MIEKLLVYPERMKENLELGGGLVHSQRVLLALTQAGMSREAAYAAVQGAAMQAVHGKGRFIELLKRDKDVAKRLSAAELKALFDWGYHTKHVDAIFKRVLG
jgi:adenylosuccinate lyase